MQTIYKPHVLLPYCVKTTKKKEKNRIGTLELGASRTYEMYVH